jgi:hypothetical protein
MAARSPGGQFIKEQRSFCIVLMVRTCILLNDPMIMVDLYLQWSCILQSDPNHTVGNLFRK